MTISLKVSCGNPEDYVSLRCNRYTVKGEVVRGRLKKVEMDRIDGLMVCGDNGKNVVEYIH